MNRTIGHPPLALRRLLLLAAALLAFTAPVRAQQGTVYRCPGPPALYTDQISAQQAKEQGCRTIEGAPITIVSPTRPRPIAGTPPSASAGSAPRPAEGRIEASEQRARDSDARKILDTELRREESRLAELQKEFNNGEPERQGGERNYQKYLERVEEMKAAIARKQSDVASLKRELAKLPAPKE